VEGVLNMPHPLGIEIGHDNLLQLFVKQYLDAFMYAISSVVQTVGKTPNIEDMKNKQNVRKYYI
jgi:hypothetical protein